MTRSRASPGRPSSRSSSCRSPGSTTRSRCCRSRSPPWLRAAPGSAGRRPALLRAALVIGAVARCRPGRSSGSPSRWSSWPRGSALLHPATPSRRSRRRSQPRRSTTVHLRRWDALMPPNSLTIVLPAYNEESRLGPALDELFGYLRRGGPGRAGLPGPGELPADITVLVVDDGSTRRHGRPRRAPAPRRTSATPDRPMLRAAQGAARRQGRRGPGRHARRDSRPRHLRRRRHGDAARPAAAPDARRCATTTSRSAAGSSPTAATCAAPSRPTGARWAGSSTCSRRPGSSGPVQDTQCGFKGFTRDGGARPVRDAAGHEHRVRRGADLPRPPARLSDRGRADRVERPPRFAHAGPTGPRAHASCGTCSGSR